MDNYNPNVEASVDHIQTIEVKKVDLDLTVGFDDDHEFKGTIHVYYHDFGHDVKDIKDIMKHDDSLTPQGNLQFSWAEALLLALHAFMSDREYHKMKEEVFNSLPESEKAGFLKWCESVPDDLQTQMEDHLKSEGLQI
jgi:hypothetical protein